jgi:uroporphyrinogen decarboxylase
MRSQPALPDPGDWPPLGPGKLTPRERVRTALDHVEPDRAPADLWAVPELWTRLQEYFGVDSRNEVLLRLDVDLRWVAPQYVGPIISLPGAIVSNPYGSLRRTVQHTYGSYEEHAGYPLLNARTPADVDAWAWPRPGYWDLDAVEDQLAELDRQGEFWICYDAGGIYERSWELRGLEQFLTDLIVNPELACAIMDRMTDLYIACARRVFERFRGRIHMAYTWDDLAHQHGLFVSPAMWRRYILPRHLRLNAVLRSYGVKIMYHCCGAMYPFIRPLVEEMGIDVLNPLQPRADGMDLSRIKTEFGARLAFHGAVDIQHTMPHGTAQDVRAEVRERCRILGKGGGYILASSHALQNDTPLENVLSLYRTPRDA